MRRSGSRSSYDSAMADPILLHVSGDLMLGGAVMTAAAGAGFEHRRALSWKGAAGQLDTLPPSLVLLDLELERFDLQSVRHWTGRHLFAGYGSHVRTSLFAAADAAGIGHLFTRGEIHAKGADRLRGLRGLVVDRQQATTASKVDTGPGDA